MQHKHDDDGRLLTSVLFHKTAMFYGHYKLDKYLSARSINICPSAGVKRCCGCMKLVSMLN